MKHIYKIFIAVLVLAGFSSCENEENLMILEPQEAAFSLITPESGSSTILNKETPNNTALTFTWEKVNYGTPTIVTYTVQFAASNTEFAAPVDITSSTNTHATITVAELNTRALALGLTPDVEGTIDVRIKSTVGTTLSEPKLSTPITIQLTPYRGVFPKVDLFLVGPGTAAGWSVTSNNMPIYRDPKEPAKQYYTGFFNKDGFKLIEQIGMWAPAYGTNGAKVQYRATEGDTDPGVFPTAASGYYSFEVNLEELTYKIEPYTGPMTTYATITLAGSVLTGDDTGWSMDVPLVKSAFDGHIWKVTQTLKAGVMKFKANGGWDTSWGDNGGNINVEAGKYEIWFNDLDGRYMFIPTP
ncbi:MULTISPECIES: SusE domain-containing protein [Flavobacterium]|uniref:SusE domain-containing protein n=1 Tax=Flavobacterium TaxID=237 RepID=UPI001183B8A5|nr:MULTISPECIES: SusE domain-containing protein [Flavobacterium]MCR4029571.1 SusE domain-containing protein [Flavobacterium panacis]